MRLKPGASSAEDYAVQVSRHLGIPHRVLELSSDFEENIASIFRREYLAGRTPNPCVRCNRLIKFGALLDFTLSEGFDFLATGHYARADCRQGSCRLLRGRDAEKDQTYFLYSLNQAQLRRVLLPLGELAKLEVRKMAAGFGLADLVRPDESQDICFIPPEGYGALVYGQEKPPPGEIVDEWGKVLGAHKGLAYYTIGQRQGLGVSSPQPLYVIKLDATLNRVVIGLHDALYRLELSAGEVAWVAGCPPQELSGITAKVRYRSPEVAVNIGILHNVLNVVFAQPQWGIAPGQSIVFYRGDEVLGGGIITG
jgi:tRNA-specific 2-thiouridylase